MTPLLQMFITEEMIYAAIKEVIDPELGINIVDLGLIYSVDIKEDGRIAINMTLTTPGCTPASPRKLIGCYGNLFRS